ncbi:hypothetical protein F4782DRAFT_528669 [Xylaria castorea]|nr:hypothetical protein F4782DRAFT_528669 [Xylaria castorea]
MEELILEPNVLSESTTYSRLGNLSLKFSSLEHPVAEMDSLAENAAASAIGHDDHAILNEGHGFTNSPEVSHPSVCMPATGISIDPSHQSLYPNISDANIPYLIEDDETVGVIPPCINLDAPTFDGNTPTTLGSSSTSTKTPNIPTASEGLDTTSFESDGSTAPCDRVYVYYCGIDRREARCAKGESFYELFGDLDNGDDELSDPRQYKLGTQIYTIQK